MSSSVPLASVTRSPSVQTHTHPHTHSLRATQPVPSTQGLSPSPILLSLSCSRLAFAVCQRGAAVLSSLPSRLLTPSPPPPRTHTPCHPPRCTTPLPGQTNLLVGGVQSGQGKRGGEGRGGARGRWGSVWEVEERAHACVRCDAHITRPLRALSVLPSACFASRNPPLCAGRRRIHPPSRFESAREEYGKGRMGKGARG